MEFHPRRSARKDPNAAFPRTGERNVVRDISRFLPLGAGVTPAEGGVEPTAGSTFDLTRRETVARPVCQHFHQGGARVAEMSLGAAGAHEVICAFDERESLVARA
jgi:hypothetical protein